jgi:hypothetical protein
VVLSPVDNPPAVHRDTLDPVSVALKPPRTLVELLLAVAGAVVLGAVLVVGVDLLFAVASLGGFGRASGAMAALPAVFVFHEEFRKQPRPGLAALCAMLALILAAGTGYAAAAVIGLPPLASGIVAALAGCVVYAVLWRIATDRMVG